MIKENAFKKINYTRKNKRKCGKTGIIDAANRENETPEKKKKKRRRDHEKKKAETLE